MIRAYDEYGNIIEDYEQRIYNKAIDETISRLKQVTNKDIVVIAKDNLDDIARELKEQNNDNNYKKLIGVLNGKKA